MYLYALYVLQNTRVATLLLYVASTVVVLLVAVYSSTLASSQLEIFVSYSLRTRVPTTTRMYQLRVLGFPCQWLVYQFSVHVNRVLVVVLQTFTRILEYEYYQQTFRQSMLLLVISKSPQRLYPKECMQCTSSKNSTPVLSTSQLVVVVEYSSTVRSKLSWSKGSTYVLLAYSSWLVGWYNNNSPPGAFEYSEKSSSTRSSTVRVRNHGTFLLSNEVGIHSFIRILGLLLAQVACLFAS